jgi:hypothetical protein
MGRHATAHEGQPALLPCKSAAFVLTACLCCVQDGRLCCLPDPTALLGAWPDCVCCSSNTGGFQCLLRLEASLQLDPGTVADPTAPAARHGLSRGVQWCRCGDSRVVHLEPPVFLSIERLEYPQRGPKHQQLVWCQSVKSVILLHA